MYYIVNGVRVWLTRVRILAETEIQKSCNLICRQITQVSFLVGLALVRPILIEQNSCIRN